MATIDEVFATVRIDDLPKIVRDGHLVDRERSVKFRAIAAVFPLWIEGKKFKDHSRLQLERINDVLPNGSFFPVSGLRSVHLTIQRRYNSTYNRWCRDVLPKIFEIIKPRFDNSIISPHETPLKPFLVKVARLNPTLDVKIDDDVISEILEDVREKIPEEVLGEFGREEVLSLFTRLSEALEIKRMPDVHERLNSSTFTKPLALESYFVEPVIAIIDSLLDKQQDKIALDSSYSELRGVTKLMISVLVPDSKELDFMLKLNSQKEVKEGANFFSLLKEMKLSPESFSNLIERGAIVAEETLYQGLTIFKVNNLLSSLCDVLEMDDEIDFEKIKKLKEVIAAYK